MDRASRIRWSTALTLLVFAVGGNYLRWSGPVEAGPIGLARIHLESPAGGTLAFQEEPIDEGFLRTLRAKEVVFRTYSVGPKQPVWVFMGYFDRQKEGSQVHSPKHCYPGSGWNIVEESTTAAPWGTGSVKVLVVSDGNQERLVHYWFQTAGGSVDNVLALKLHLTRNAALRRPQDVVFVRVSTLLDGDREAARSRLTPYSLELKKDVEELYRVRNETG
jgi:EpsI family protein